MASGWDSVQAGMYMQATDPARRYVAKWVGGNSIHSSPEELSQGWSILLTGTQRTRATGWAKASQEIPGVQEVAGQWASPCDPVGEEPVGDVNVCAVSRTMEALTQRKPACTIWTRAWLPDGASLTLQNAEASALRWIPGPRWWRMERKPWKRKRSQRAICNLRCTGRKESIAEQLR